MPLKIFQYYFFLYDLSLALLKLSSFSTISNIGIAQMPFLNSSFKISN